VRTTDQAVITELARWQTVGVEGSVHPLEDALPRPITIPVHDGGPTVRVVPRRASASFTYVNGLWHCSALTAVGDPLGTPDTYAVGYTWTDVEAGLAMLPDYVSAFVRRSTPLA
jgi:hypothetical protein